MAKVIDAYRERGGRPVVICDFTPPKGVARARLDAARGLEVDFVSVAYNPGKAVRVDSAMMSYAIKKETGRDVVFSLATRDMNRLALESHLLGAGFLGLENLLVMGGDPFGAADKGRVRAVDDFKPTELIRAAAEMNRGRDFRGRRLSPPTGLCVGGVIDLGRGVEAEARLTHRKALAGADFFVTQPIFCAGDKARFEAAYRVVAGQSLERPVFYGLQIPVKGGVALGPIPKGVQRRLDEGRGGVKIALETWQGFLEAGVGGVYLVPPILKGGARDYGAAAEFLKRTRA